MASTRTALSELNDLLQPGVGGIRTELWAEQKAFHPLSAVLTGTLGSGGSGAGL